MGVVKFFNFFLQIRHKSVYLVSEYILSQKQLKVKAKSFESVQLPLKYATKVCILCTTTFCPSTVPHVRDMRDIYQMSLIFEGHF